MRLDPQRNKIRLFLGLCLGFAVLCGFLFFVEQERDWLDRIWVLFLEGALFSGVLTLTARPFFSALLAFFPFMVVSGISRFKYSQMNMPAMLPDLKYLMGSNIIELLQHHSLTRIAVFTLVAGLCGFVVVCRLLYRHENPVRWPRRRMRNFCVVSSSFCALFFGIQVFIHSQSAGLATGQSKERRFLDTRSTISTFVLSAFWSTRLQPVAARGSATRLPTAVPAMEAGATKKHPHIVVILEESTFQVGSLLKPQYREFASGLLKPAGGFSRELIVYTHGGNTWLTEFAALTGIPHVAFGGTAPYVIPIMTGKIRTGFPEYLKKQGYATFSQIPTSEKFINIGEFYRSVGFDHVYSLPDRGELGRAGWAVTDREIFEHALDRFSELLTQERKPVFAWILTMRQHGPHAMTAESKPYLEFARDDLPDEVKPQLAEFLYRCNSSAEGMQYLKQEFSRRFPGEQFVLLHFGDHQPAFTAHLWPDSSAKYRSYVAIETINAIPARSLDLPETVDIAFLPVLLTAYAGLTPDENLSVEAELAIKCNYQYYGFPVSEAVADYHRFLLDRRLVLLDQ